MDILNEVDVILAEDTRHTSILLKHWDIRKPMYSHHNFNEHKKTQGLIKLMKEGRKMAMVSDAGTPCVSDPGYILVNSCIKEGLKIECLPGATAIIPALVLSGFPTDRFVFEGFLPRKKGRTKRLREISLEKRTIIIYESPKRINKTLLDLMNSFGEDRLACICKDISKRFEENYLGSLKELHERTITTTKGEVVLLVKSI